MVRLNSVGTRLETSNADIIFYPLSERGCNIELYTIRYSTQLCGTLDQRGTYLIGLYDRPFAISYHIVAKEPSYAERLSFVTDPFSGSFLINSQLCVVMCSFCRAKCDRKSVPLIRCSTLHVVISPQKVQVQHVLNDFLYGNSCGQAFLDKLNQ